MQDPGILELVAELGIAVLGFSGIVVVLDRRSPGDWSEPERFKFTGMLSGAAGVVVLSLLPFPFISAGATQAHVWGWSSGLGALLAAILIVRQFKRGIISQLWSNPEVSKPMLAFGLLVGIASPLLFMLNATGILFERTLAPYLVAVLLILVASLMAFTRMLQVYVGRAA